MPHRVVPLSADMGVVAGVRRVATHLYCWPSWFLLTVETAGDLAPACAQGPPRDPWELEDDRGGHYHGAWTGGWAGSDTGAHIACAPGLDPLAAELRITFTDPFASAGRLTATVPVPTALG